MRGAVVKFANWGKVTSAVDMLEIFHDRGIVNDCMRKRLRRLGWIKFHDGAWHETGKPDSKELARIDEKFRVLMAEYPDPVDPQFRAVPEAVIRRFAIENGMLEDVALGRYGWWADGCHQWKQFAPPREQVRV
jgi:hypothetical protein